MCGSFRTRGIPHDARCASIRRPCADHRIRSRRSSADAHEPPPHCRQRGWRVPRLPAPPSGSATSPRLSLAAAPRTPSFAGRAQPAGRGALGPSASQRSGQERLPGAGSGRLRGAAAPVSGAGVRHPPPRKVDVFPVPEALGSPCSGICPAGNQWSPRCGPAGGPADAPTRPPPPRFPARRQVLPPPARGPALTPLCGPQPGPGRPPSLPLPARRVGRPEASHHLKQTGVCLGG